MKLMLFFNICFRTNQNQLNQDSSRKQQEYNATILNMTIYSSLVMIMFLSMILRNMSIISACTRASVQLHDHIFSRLLRAPMSFFELNPTGCILNRFAKDIGSIDEFIPIIFSNLISVSLFVE